ncbi:methyl-accepting chemotaxis protein [Citrobacter sp. JGM124]|uniref:methyl-accepting chemotaxis protein n=1 Tax=Citrobacter sp. JGM124 TaxID=2799789 RepID=UPI001BA581E1|nr:methyl-accepting chemotaxis protein [Citrobacter sp. JGM124]MBS0846984.1 Tar ligand binding domain-containing protein [Citrobacter sp. JGM124]
MFNRIKISTTLFIILVICGVLQIGSNGLSFWASHDDYQNLKMVESSNQQRELLTQSRAALLQAGGALGRAGTLTALSYPVEDVKRQIVLARENLKQATAYFAQFSESVSADNNDAEMITSAQQSFTGFEAALAKQISWLENNQLSEFLNAPVGQAQDSFESYFTLWQQEINQRITDARSDSEINYQLSAIIFGCVAVIAIMLTLGSLWWSRKMIVQPLGIVRDHFDSIAAGDLAKPIAVFGRNEISLIFASLKKMQSALKETITQVRDNSNAMYSGVSEISMGNNDLSARTEQQAASLAQTAASMEQLTATVGQNADNARQAAQLSHAAADKAKQGGNQTATVARTMQEITGSSQKISDITNVIDSIAFQTNILALNAAVEAARAGEQGRGFAVVAGEVRNLASRSAQAAKEIKALIEESVNRVQQGSKSVEAAAITMAEIVHSVTQVNDIMGEIASASDEQRHGIAQVAQAVSQMDLVTQQNAALVEESASATESLASQTEHLTQVVNVFRLSDV